ncbi:MAG: TonB C-terminal domain-containing protein [Myxococcota bacterium]
MSLNTEQGPPPSSPFRTKSGTLRIRLHSHASLELDEEELPSLKPEPRLSPSWVEQIPAERETGLQAPPDRLARWLMAAVLLHVGALFLLCFVASLRPPSDEPPPEPMEVVPLDLSTMDLPEESLPAVQPPVLPPQPVEQVQAAASRPMGQVVDLPPPPQPQQAPPDARYMAEQDHRVDQQLQSEKSAVNPKQVAERYEDPNQKRAEQAEASATLASPQVASVAVPDPAASSEQAQPSAPAPELPELEGGPERPSSATRAQPRPLNLFPSNQQVAMVLRQSAREAQEGGSTGGAPDTNVLDVAKGDRTALNAKGSEYARYFNGLRRQFNYYYSQASDQLRRSDVRERIFDKTYVTRFVVTLNAQGQVVNVRILQSANVYAFDELIRTALRNASPFDAPPAGLLDARGILELSGECRLGVGMGVPNFAR